MSISIQEVRAHLAQSKGRWPEVSRGAGVDYFTVVRIASGKSKQPRYETIEKLSAYFATQSRPA